AEASENSAVPILYERANFVRRVDDLVCVIRRRQGRDHVGFGHWHVNHAVLRERMSAGKQSLRIDVCNGAGGSDIEITAYEDCAHGGSGLDRLRLMIVGGRSHSHNGNQSSLRKLR